ncbi:MAG: hypothetical protein CL694_15250 [Chloroflexi bacterium]|nr:hypothetical protein [Chloroflexota bacterium]MDP6422319.1 glycoside hydrolase family 15 protein [SAR202 cluster bacterium]MDP6663409.1 glycoside hydrolase family 15 protein [SAR202 cluster bacterium]HAL46148.1 hypothetical protein [Dehalococcoidia bacterium]
MYKPIDQYGLIGDMNSAALVGTDGSIDWCCFPHFDSPSVFAAILDDRKGGRFQIAPRVPNSRIQSYLPNTNILSTRFTTPTGQMSLTDFMPLGNGRSGDSCPHEIHRVVRCTSGTVDVACTFQPSPDYGRSEVALSRVSDGVVARGNRQMLTLVSDAQMEIEDGEAVAKFTLRAGEEVVFVLAYGSRRPQRIGSYHTMSKFAQTKVYWEVMASGMTYDGLWRDDVVRSFLLLQLMIYAPTGAVIAAPTTSLPEAIGGSRNWDYRYSWLRDSSFTMDVLFRMGQVERAEQYQRWLLDQCRLITDKPKILYGIKSNSSLKTADLDHLEGYKGSSPVRVGNRAVGQVQLDVFGEVILCFDTLRANGGAVSDEAWSLVKRFANLICDHWRDKDRGVWEVRGPKQHFVYSKVMCWTGLDRAIAIAHGLGIDNDVERWRHTADAIRQDVLEHGWSAEKQAFAQHYATDALDASNLVMPFVGFLPPNDPRVISTMEAISDELGVGPLIRRYNPVAVDDGLGGQTEGAFTILSFWYIGNLIAAGRVQEAKECFEELLSYANHVGLFAEMINPWTKEALGNFPQAYSHIGLVHTARNLSRALGGASTRSNLASAAD